MSKSNKKDVGKGIRALLSNIEKVDSSKKGIKTDEFKSISSNYLPLKYIEPNPFQPRSEFDESELEELTESIRIHGIIQPIAVRKLNSKTYQIISGERRWRAAKTLKLDKIPIYVLEANDQAMLEIALLENIQRADLNPIEIAVSYQRLLTECSLTHEELSDRIGKKRSSISNYIRLLKLSPSVQDALRKREISLGHAKLLVGVDQIEKQTLILGQIIRDDLSVRATESLIKNKTKSTKTNTLGHGNKSSEILKITREISEFLGAKVKIQRSEKGIGFIKIPFSSDREFNDLIDSIIDK